MLIDEGFASRYAGWKLNHALAHIDARLSALEAAQKKPDATTPEQREPGLYPIKAENGLYAVRRWSQTGRWLNQSGYKLVDASEPAWIGPRIPEPGE
jgi:hypothetical protein